MSDKQTRRKIMIGAAAVAASAVLPAASVTEILNYEPADLMRQLTPEALLEAANRATPLTAEERAALRRAGLRIGSMVSAAVEVAVARNPGR